MVLTLLTRCFCRLFGYIFLLVLFSMPSVGRPRKTVERFYSDVRLCQEYNIGKFCTERN